MNAPTNLAADDAKKAYLERCYKMTHAELYAELMRVHTEAHRLIQEAVKQENQRVVKAIEDYVEKHDREYKEFGLELAGLIEGKEA